MVDFVEINNAKLAYQLCGPDHAPLIITLHGGRGFGMLKSLKPFATANTLGVC